MGPGLRRARTRRRCTSRSTSGDVAARVADALEAVWRGDTESDSLNRLVVGAGLRWPQVQVLRAYRRYRQRIGSRYTESFQNDVIAANPAITAKLIRLFELRFATDDAAGTRRPRRRCASRSATTSTPSRCSTTTASFATSLG